MFLVSLNLKFNKHLIQQGEKKQTFMFEKFFILKLLKKHL